MFNKILVAIDMSEMGKKVFESALSIAKKECSSLLLLHVLSAEEAVGATSRLNNQQSSKLNKIASQKMRDYDR
jgi:nucleotide-binding universal stress UspA family protein